MITAWSKTTINKQPPTLFSFRKNCCTNVFLERLARLTRRVIGKLWLEQREAIKSLLHPGQFKQAFRQSEVGFQVTVVHVYGTVTISKCGVYVTVPSGFNHIKANMRCNYLSAKQLLWIRINAKHSEDYSMSHSVLWSVNTECRGRHNISRTGCSPLIVWKQGNGEPPHSSHPRVVSMPKSLPQGREFIIIKIEA